MNATCNKCGWVHFTVTEQYIREWEAEWKHFFNTWTKQHLAAYGVTDRVPSNECYYRCFRCGNDYKDFHDSKPGEVLDGSTLQSICERPRDER